ncbi:MAG: Wzt carbohydrate-binding domain-containing protein [Anaerolineae bacterium]|nr:Wzt carbohydrate-binding domain-containing protein [Anaerolineae bacterium]
MIPKKIHYCWFGQQPKSPQIQKCIASWQEIMPDFAIKEWNETNSPMNSLYIQSAYKKGLWSKISNFIRLYAVYSEGGLYFDTDIEVLKHFDPLLDNKCFLGFQQEVKDIDWVNNAVIGAVPQHPFLIKCMNATLAHFLDKRSFCRSPEITTYVLSEMGVQTYGLQTIEDIRLFPVEYFYPYPWWDEFNPDVITGDTYCIHHWELSWFDKDKNPPKENPQVEDKVIPVPEHLTPEARVGSMEMEIVNVHFFDEQERCIEKIKSGALLHIKIEYKSFYPINTAFVSLSIEREGGILCFETDSEFTNAVTEHDHHEVKNLDLFIERLDLTDGDYLITVGLFERTWAYAYDYHWRVCSFTVYNSEVKKGILSPPLYWRSDN